MIAEIGVLGLMLTVGASVYSVIACLWGAYAHRQALIESGRTAALLTSPLLFITLGVLLVGLVGGAYQITYVHQVTDPNTPLFYRITALWGSQQGSLIFWSFTMSLFTSGAILSNWRTHAELMPFATAVMMTTLAFFVGLSLFLENPFERYWILANNVVVQDIFIPSQSIAPELDRLAQTASGLNPLLRHFGMIIHPPMLYLGFVGFIVPYAFAIAALASGNLSTDWIKITRQWTLWAWLFLSLGLLLGGRWAYDVLGWGGYWGWDPVENAAFLPWLMGTAFLHSVMVQERRGMLKKWNLFLIIATFTSVIFGTFATRSGLIDSVHSFARSPIGVPMFLFWAGMMLVSSILLVIRWNRGELEDDQPFRWAFNREMMFVLNNIVFMILFFAIFWGSFGAPIASELTSGVEISLGSQYFNGVTAPFFGLMYVLMGIAPLTAWGRSTLTQLQQDLLIPLLLTLIALVGAWFLGATTPASLLGYGLVFLAGFVTLYMVYKDARSRQVARQEAFSRSLWKTFVRGRRRYGGFIVHLGIVVIGLGVIGSTLFQYETQRTLQLGETLDVQGYRMTFERLDSGQIAEDGRVMDIATLTLSKGDQTYESLRPRRDLFQQSDGSFMPMTIASARSTLAHDFYVLLVGWEELSPDRATFKVYVNPLINLVWWGGMILMLGTVLSVWNPATSPKRATVTNRVKPSAGVVTA